MEAAAAALVLALSFLLLRFLDRRRRRFSSLALALVSLVAASGAWTVIHAARLPGPEDGVVNRPIESELAGYATSRSCESCHPRQYATWDASYHSSMTQLVTPDSVAPNFHGTVLEWGGKTHRIERRDDSFWVVDSHGAPEGKQIVMRTGSHSVQVYWLESEEGRQLEMLPFHYLMSEDKWVSREAAFLIPPGSAFFGADWNKGCIHCHTTRGEPRVGQGGVDTRAVEFGITCEACHGPGEAHVQKNQNPLRRYWLHFGEGEDPSIVNPRRLSKQRASEVCGRCHGYGRPGPADRSRFEWSGFTFVPGRELSYSRQIQLLDEVPERAKGRASTMFWKDGMVRGSGREFGMLLESPCFQFGEMSCLSCHTMHPPADDPRPIEAWANDQLKLGMDSNEACQTCHPALVADVEAHSHHPAESAGALCYNCHMPYTTYGLLKAIRSHEISSPSVAASLETGRPNACNQCHLDQPLAWAADRLQDWYEVPAPELGPDERDVAASLQWLLSGDAAQRALMAWSMGWEPAREASDTDWMAPYLAQLLEDPYPAVRFIAKRSLGRIPGFGAFEYDFVDSAEERREAHERALATWASGTSARPRSPALIQADGQVLREVFARLLDARNDRPVIVAE